MAYKWTWRAKAFVLRVIDGDTILVRMDLGWRVWFETRVRFSHANAEELGTPSGDAASLALAQKLPQGTEIILESHALDTYGRTLGEVYVTSSGEDVETWLISNGHAVSRPGFVEGGTIHNLVNAPTNIQS